MGRTRLWEDSVVIALRDFQWRNAVEDALYQRDDLAINCFKSPLPPGMLKHDGRAESKLGDVSLKNGERLFLFEVKSTRSQISSEWRHSRGMKWSFRRLNDLAAQVIKIPESHAASNMLSLSLRGHHICYWNDCGEEAEVSGGYAVKGGLDAQPYIAACVEAQSLQERLGSSRMSWSPKWGRDIFRRSLDSADRRVISLSDLINSKAVLKVAVAGMNQGQPCGLDAEEFAKYVAFLCGTKDGRIGIPSDDEAQARGAEDVHVVVMSSKGTLFRVVSDTAHMEMLLDGAFRPGPVRERKRRVILPGKPEVRQ